MIFKSPDTIYLKESAQKMLFKDWVVELKFEGSKDEDITLATVKRYCLLEKLQKENIQIISREFSKEGRVQESYRFTLEGLKQAGFKVKHISEIMKG